MPTIPYSWPLRGSVLPRPGGSITADSRLLPRKKVKDGRAGESLARLSQYNLLLLGRCSL